MSKKCWRIDYLNCADVVGTGYECEEDISIVSSQNACGPVALRATSGKFTDGNSTCKSLSVNVVDCSNCPNCCGVSVQKCDCLNGGCISQQTYNTPGKYASLEDCQARCAKDSNCDGECVSAAEIAALQQTANLVRNKLCR
jgi:hypothetical protein